MAPRSLSEADVLLGVRDDLRQGALRFRLSEDGPYLAQDSGAEIARRLHERRLQAIAGLAARSQAT